MAEFAEKLLKEMREEDGKQAIADVIAAVGFLFADQLPGDLYELLASPPDDTIERVQRLVIIREEAVMREEVELGMRDPDDEAFFRPPDSGEGV
jgi:hypothetical protein